MERNEIYIRHAHGNLSSEMQRALSQVRNDCENVISFEKGTYTFGRKGTYHGMFYPSNNASGEKDVVFPILNMKNLTIDGNGSEFLFTDRIFPFIIQNSENICLKNFSIDFSFLRYAWATVKAVREDAFVLSIDRSLFDYETEHGHLVFHVGEDDLTTAAKKLAIKCLVPKRWVTFLFAGDSSDPSDQLPAPVIFTDAKMVDGDVVFTYREGSRKLDYNPGDIMYIGNDNSRENGVFLMEFSRNLRFENIDMFSGAGMGYIGQMSTDIVLENCRILPKPGREAWFSITADGLHFVNCDGQLIFRNCTVKKSMDDAVNVHGVYTIVDRLTADNAAEIRLCHREQEGLIPYLAGDEVHISDACSMRETGTAIVKAVDYDENREHITLTFDRDVVALLKPGDILENPGRMPELTIENCDIEDCPHMRISSSKKTVIRHNRLRLAWRDIYINDLFQYWYESGAVTDVLIENNSFGNSSHGNICAESTRCEGAEHWHGTITVRNNTFTKPRDEAIQLSAVAHFIEENNRFEEAEA